MMSRPSAIREIMKMCDDKTVRAMGLDPEDVISFGGGWVGHSAPDSLRDIYLDICGDPSVFHEAGAYPPTPGLRQCRASLARMEEDLFRMDVSEDNVLVSQSSTQLTHDLFRVLADPGDCVVLLDPTYANYYGQLIFSLTRWRGENGCNEADAEVSFLRTMDMETWSYMPDVDRSIGELEDLFRRKDPRMLLIPTPDNPTGQVVPGEFMEAALELCQENDAYLVVDYAYKTQCFLDSYPDYFSWSPQEMENLVLIFSNSKWARGLGRRMGWIMASEKVVEALTQLLNYSLLCGDNLHQMAMARFLDTTLEDGSLRSYIHDINEDYKRAADVTVRSIDEFIGARRLEPQGGLYTVMDLGTDTRELVPEIMRNTGVLFVPGAGFGPSFGQGVRVSYGPLVYDPEIIREGMRRAGEYLKSRKLI
ncbi:MAG: pyridoxal phosphate-dependent aminotransferase [Methanomassiliicoccales archaeon]